ncbi:precorrin-2 C(20)-methyltransferase [Alkaliphilus oremlandii]|uniref:Uroporphyrin-III C/tetrapyrrole (Corrin/Porphyrin) methyltransferase n=1 Tax=Alkaliphilus oremlandii (strain OhILAs) TaxID=350688 RepID=A8MG32_ALKOO|nr:precorrin-2 C(20)-methyltransferase [Alkaliphilus oremlandii]ABW18570.1 Uroporphyrin-III C/tetrapyrrole (Corrin/Porphyrin) methyltransferase [Alkaliphilus oremlandii OhILAs]
MKKIYGIGTGPGDKELLTLKAVRMINEASVIFAPNNKGKNIALDTVADHIANKKVIMIDFPMGRVAAEDYVKAAEIIHEETPENGVGVFLTIGDPMVYSTFIYTMEQLEKFNVTVEVIPGIPSFVAAAASAKLPLTIKGDNFLLCDDFQEDLLDSVESICILKTFKDKERIIDSLEKKNFDYQYVKHCTWDDEEILTDKETILRDKNYISLILGRKR